MLYQQEFGLDFQLGFNLYDFPKLKDRSYHNDDCPSFYFNIKKQYFVLWVDYPQKHQREIESDRYTLQLADNEGDEVSPEVYAGSNEVIYSCESPKKLIVYLMQLFEKDKQS
ncbi:hypothetical protein [Catenovulum adriaticum]|uniref:Uncharacterized protein n=1 Tax=Catenovulum adriaticum TaxID=2984846 RepID=A0ABY7ALB2_9ALTE|nr:hypothetical protein [Catenovulum sp. TS8]WAJ69522.1 hypothetical protein OLW01_10100 [Catenovulum sp. TS8]